MARPTPRQQQILRKLVLRDFVIDVAGRDGLGGLLFPNKYADKGEPVRVSVQDMTDMIANDWIRWNYQVDLYEPTEAARKVVEDAADQRGQAGATDPAALQDRPV